VNLLLALSWFALIYLALGTCWLAWMWHMRSPREIAETDRIQRQYGWSGIAFLVLLGITLWPMILFTAWRR
jgi:hypothetical protein